MPRLFVYGSLKRGCVHHDVLGPDARFVGKARLLGYRLHRLGSYPVIVSEAGSVVGEVYVVPDDRMPVLDAFEGDSYCAISVRLEDGIETLTYALAANATPALEPLEGDNWTEP
jgi:gamma-glutamylcyclotransferase (GGCT)/AIG2-like uncharacterized protein YtfP